MSDKLTPIPIRNLFKWIIREFKTRKSILGIYEDQFFIPNEKDPFRTERYGYLLDAPLGVAAGPHTQLSQNIIASWLCGARYIELKTIQTLDNLEVSKPCIDMEDEGYNCEWSQELQLRQSYEEYLNAWILLHIIKKFLGWDAGGELGTIFNLSAGYNLNGILNENVQGFLDLMENCSDDLQQKLDELDDLFPVHELSIPERISDNLTLSTMHGCPPDEIEKIARYFIEKRNYHTAVKLNPTLLGSEKLRDILNNLSGFNHIIVPDEAFEHDLKYNESLDLISNLRESAAKTGVSFGLKLTNTLEVKNSKDIFPAAENMSYMSGRALHPISINVAAKLQNQFKGKLDISFSAGVDAFNFAPVIACNIKPVTTCTDILKPGGYTRLKQYIANLKTAMKETGAGSIEEFVIQTAGDGENLQQSGLKNLLEYAVKTTEDSLYQKKKSNFNHIKTSRELTAFDCVSAPCIENCATDQNIPLYMYHTARGNIDLAYDAIRLNNPLPGVTGYVCDHLCELKCTRQNMDNPILIREIKRYVTEKAGNRFPATIGNFSTRKVAVVGAGPSGLTCAWFLAVNGVQVEVFESGDVAGGMVTRGIPSFRLNQETINLDIQTIVDAGVKIHYNSKVNGQKFRQIRSEFDAVYLSSGAQLNKKLGIPGESLPGVIEPLDFLYGVKNGKQSRLGKKVAVIGGGNTALDASRTALRLGNGETEVDIIYRRTMKEMPADYIEVLDAMEEGVNIRQLLAPEKIKLHQDRLILTCCRMELGELDSSGRARPVKVKGSERELVFDTIIPAIGQEVEYDFISPSELNIDKPGRMLTGEGLFSGGDVVRGASSVVNAVGDGQHTAKKIMKYLKISGIGAMDNMEYKLRPEEYQQKLAERKFGPEIRDFVDLKSLDFGLISRTMSDQQAQSEASRCLFCDDECNICVSVCPNRANLTYRIIPGKFNVWRISGVDNPSVTPSEPLVFRQQPQIVNIVDACNECGNCTTFCPTAGRPFVDKPRICISSEVFDIEDNCWYIDDRRIMNKVHGSVETLQIEDNILQYSMDNIKITLSSTDFSVLDSDIPDEIVMDTSNIIRMWVLYNHLNDYPLFNNRQ